MNENNSLFKYLFIYLFSNMAACIWPLIHNLPCSLYFFKTSEIVYYFSKLLFSPLFLYELNQKYININ